LERRLAHDLSQLLTHRALIASAPRALYRTSNIPRSLLHLLSNALHRIRPRRIRDRARCPTRRRAGHLQRLTSHPAGTPSRSIGHVSGLPISHLKSSLPFLATTIPGRDGVSPGCGRRSSRPAAQATRWRCPSDHHRTTVGERPGQGPVVEAVRRSHAACVCSTKHIARWTVFARTHSQMDHVRRTSEALPPRDVDLHRTRRRFLFAREQVAVHGSAERYFAVGTPATGPIHGRQRT
ncbi:MAG: hypothetical protein JWN32_2898, partial [Solirubrobacterales bacterium]|nr:hypothetical protein [Solirubrobacterales bacterium]